MADNDTIVVIDSGIDINHPWFKDVNITGLSILKRDDEYIIDSDYSDTFGHGTAVCGILAKNIEDAKLMVIKLYGKDSEIEVDALEYALEYIYDNIDCCIINMSFGVLCSTKRLHDICRRLHNKGVILVSALDNIGALSYPAVYDEVIGVDSSDYCIRPNDLLYLENNLITVGAKGGNHRLAWVNPQFIINQGASFSAPYVTSMIKKMINSGATYKDINNELKLKSKKIITNSNLRYTGENSKIPFKITNAAVFPYNKEIHSLLNFPDLLNFNISGTYDSKYLGKVSKRVKSIDGKNEYCLKSINDIDYTAIDTLILGHVAEIDFHTNRNIKEELIRNCLENNINIYSLDDKFVDQYKEQFNIKGLYICYPHKTGAEFNHRKAGRLYSISAPVLGIYGTSNQQGKFTLQLQLRREFLKTGYKIGQLGTEPTSMLFGMNDVYPFGYSSTVDMEGSKAVEALNEIMHTIDLTEPEIIITGCQAGTIPMFFSNLVQLHIQQINFMLGTLPDAVVVCVNLYDEPELIRRTVYSIENIVDCKVIAFAISPLTFPNDWYFMNGRKVAAEREVVDSFKQMLKKNFGRESFVIGDDREIKELFNVCIEYF